MCAQTRRTNTKSTEILLVDEWTVDGHDCHHNDSRHIRMKNIIIVIEFKGKSIVASHFFAFIFIFCLFVYFASQHCFCYWQFFTFHWHSFLDYHLNSAIAIHPNARFTICKIFNKICGVLSHIFFRSSIVEWHEKKRMHSKWSTKEQCFR